MERDARTEDEKRVSAEKSALRSISNVIRHIADIKYGETNQVRLDGFYIISEKRYDDLSSNCGSGILSENHDLEKCVDTSVVDCNTGRLKEEK